MPNFDLSQYINNPKDKSIEEQIAELRSLARSCRDKNNELVQRIRDIKQTLEQPGQEKAQLENELAVLQKKLDGENYPLTFTELTQIIHDLEVQHYGTSDVGGDSPYIL